MSNYKNVNLNKIAESNASMLDEARQLALQKMQETLAQGGLRMESGGFGTMRAGGLESMGNRQESMESFASHGQGKSMLEAIVHRIIRPSMLVKNGTYLPPDAASTTPDVLNTIMAFNRTKIDPAIAITGRVELIDVPGVPFLGTGWIIEKPKDNQAIIVTNRHVAAEFARASQNGGYRMRRLPNGQDYEVMLDFLEEHGQTGSREAPVVSVLYIAADTAPDIALLKIDGDAVKGLSPLALASAAPKQGDQIGVVGYPAFDSRNNKNDMTAYFGTIYNVKRFAFGDVNGVSTTRAEFNHDATTLGGNSGSPVFNRNTSEIVGLHFAGEAGTANYAVPISEVKAALKGLTSSVVVASRSMTDEIVSDGTTPVNSFKGRDGYRETFLGKSALSLKAPIAPSDLATVKDADTGGDTHELKYRHFSVWMSESRKLPMITAVNINGEKAKRIGRIDKWYADGRVAADGQVGNEAYRGNALDRGHMVRREDPVHGTKAEATEANRDTFHYTNSAPQHEDLNQKDWVNLEDYVLGNAKTRGLKVSVFTGPVFRDTDPLYREVVRIPKAFWKIVGIVNDETGKLSVTAYVLTQDDMIRDMADEFVYGGFRTYQVEVAKVGELTGLDVSHLAKHDPFAGKRRQENAVGNTGAFQVIGDPDDLVL